MTTRRRTVLAGWAGLAAWLVLAAVGVGGGCERSPATPPAAPPKAGSDEPLAAVATVGMVADLVKAVGGDDVRVTTLIGPGVDPHLYRPTRTDIAVMTSASVVFANGLMLEGKLGEALTRVETSGVPVVRVAEGLIAQGKARADERAHGDAGPGAGHDPHVWMDPSLWARCVPAVREALTTLRPGQAEAFASRASAYERELVALDEYAREAVATVPERARVLVTAHDAFNYFGARYGIEVVGVQGISTESEAGLGDIERLVTLLVDRRVPAVFVESTVSDRNMRALIDGARARGHVVTVGGELFSDAMGAAGTPEGTYVGMIAHNVTTIVRALGGTASGFPRIPGAHKPDAPASRRTEER